MKGFDQKFEMMTKQATLLTPPSSPENLKASVNYVNRDSYFLSSENASKVCIVGVGFVGLHLVECFSRKHNVVGFDINSSRIEFLKENHPMERAQFTNDLEKIKKCRLFCVSVPTLLKDQAVDFTFVEKAIAMIAKFIQPGCVVVIESSVSVGTSRRLLTKLRYGELLRLFLADSNLKLSQQDVYVGFSPERVDPGRTVPAAHEIAKVISAIDEPSLANIHRWYSSVYETVVPVSSMETAEMSKLYENCFRMINIAYVNEISDACQQHGIDAQEMIQACSSKPYGFMPFTPGLGVGGTCIPVNPYYLFENNELPLLKIATQMSEARPIRKARDLVQQFRPKSVLVIGVAYKPGTHITYCSPVNPFIKTLREAGVDVTCYDPLAVQKETKNLSQDDWKVSVVDSFDLIVVAVKQTGVDFSLLKCVDSRKVIIF